MRAVTKSTFVCARCGLGVHKWESQSGPGWKHAAGGPVRGCGQPPVPVERWRYEGRKEALRDVKRELTEDEIAQIDVMHANGWGIDEAQEEVLARRENAEWEAE